ncbi:hypothetical protein THTE_0341 [Thermogutta terrifontis]|uniref:DUF1570 domain-containing protein n=2 Tax=Thermogutta terrifontis TaxID=1331910 RepID=A0A286RAI0_9BACT|nr:hypothetical protein THTE_0341 [Thermogutta terrifontis]
MSKRVTPRCPSNGVQTGQSSTGKVQMDRCSEKPQRVPPANWASCFLAGLSAVWLLLSAGEISAQGPGADVSGRRYPGFPIDDGRLLQAGLHKIASSRLTLYTDLPVTPEIDELGRVFDAAYPQWCAFFAIAPDSRPWKMTGFLMRDPRPFRELGVLPSWLPPFTNGFSVGNVLWIYEQPSAYYRRHLLIHEGTHGFLRAHFGDWIPPWYNEGIAELLGTHFWDGRTLQLGVVPKSRDEVPMWGRIRIVRDAVAQKRPLSLTDILNFGPTAHRDLEPYGWCWAATALFAHDPRFQPAFKKLPPFIQRGNLQNFNENFLRLLGPTWKTAEYQWLIVLADLDYGYDFERTAADFTPGSPVLTGGSAVRVEAGKGWQNAGLQLEVGKRYQLTATGRFIVAQDGGPWECEPQGVTIRYVRGHPLGTLLAAVVPVGDSPPRPGAELNTRGSFFQPIAVGRGYVLTAERTGTLFLRINDSAAELSDNSGDILVKVLPLP